MINADFMILLFILSQVILVLVVRWWLIRQKKIAISTLKAYFEPDANGGPSEFARFIDIVSENFASRLISSLRGSLLNLSSISSRQEKAVDGAIAQDMISQVPLAGAALQAFPALGKLIKKNPAVAGIVQQKLMEFMMSKGAGAAQQPQVPAGSNGGSHNTPLEIN